MVTRQIGRRDSFKVNSAALVRFLSEVRRERPFQKDLENILAELKMQMREGGSEGQAEEGGWDGMGWDGRGMVIIK